MRSHIAVAYAISLAHIVSAADNAIVTGPKATEVTIDTWKDVASSPTNGTTSKFKGFDTSKPYPSSDQEGWELSIGVKENVNVSNSNATAIIMSINPPSNGSFNNSWHFCLYTFNVNPRSASKYYAGQKDSCSNLVAKECIDDIKKIAVNNSAVDGCTAYQTTPSCLRDISEQTAMALSVPANNASNVFTKNSPIYRRIDTGEKAFKLAASQPMLVVTVFGTSAKSEKAPTPEVACILPNAKSKTSGTSKIACFTGWAVATLAVALQLSL